MYSRILPEYDESFQLDCLLKVRYHIRCSVVTTNPFLNFFSGLCYLWIKLYADPMIRNLESVTGALKLFPTSFFFSRELSRPNRRVLFPLSRGDGTSCSRSPSSCLLFSLHYKDPLPKIQQTTRPKNISGLSHPRGKSWRIRYLKLFLKGNS